MPIRVATQEQQNGVVRISTAISDIDEMTQQNAAMFEQLAATAQSHNQQMQRVTDTVGLFKPKPSDKSAADVDAVALRRSNDI